MLPPVPPHPVPLCVTALVLVAASTDITSRRIPNRLVAVGLAGALIAQCVLHGVASGAFEWFAGAATGFALLLPLYLLRGMAAGDVKLMLAIGAWVGPWMVACIVLATCVAGGVGAIAVTIWRGSMRRMLGNVRHLLRRALAGQSTSRAAISEQMTSVGSLPYGVAIAAGTLAMLFASAI
ncbi:A24 family peptidase [Burkholderia guangdongensis]|uniref:A24 family peptidase n=1 Tax=Burkholderia guangdongensis TaxID=1792500 RepID=UPI0015CEF017|nr:prepilin peptidase [Burkholderia guangdongensis]